MNFSLYLAFVEPLNSRVPTFISWRRLNGFSCQKIRGSIFLLRFYSFRNKVLCFFFIVICFLENLIWDSAIFQKNFNKSIFFYIILNRIIDNCSSFYLKTNFLSLTKHHFDSGYKIIRNFCFHQLWCG